MNEINYDGWADMLEPTGDVGLSSPLVEAVPRRARHRMRTSVRRPRMLLLRHRRTGWSVRLYGR